MNILNPQKKNNVQDNNKTMNQRYLAALIIFFALNSGVYSFQQFDPSYKWNTITTENFHIHYHDYTLPEALRAAGIAEKYHGPLTAAAGWKPRARTHIIVSDSSDLANGWATPFPRNTVKLYIARPYLDGSLSNYDDFLELLFIHEYTHILNLDAADHFIAMTRYFPGRLLFPNAHLPIWAIEGSAINFESLFTKSGRNNSSYTDMILRTEVEEDSLKSITEASHFPRSWPRGYVPYLYGGKFVEFIEERYGEGAFTGYMLENAGNFPYTDTACLIPIFYNRNARRVFQKTFDMLWDEWHEEIKTRYISEIESIRKRGITQAVPVSNPESNSTSPVFSKEGTEIYYIESQKRGSRRLVRHSPGQPEAVKLSRVNYPSALTGWHDGKLLTADIEFHRSYSLYSDLFIFDGKRYKKTGRAPRATHAGYSENSGRTIYTSASANLYSLSLIEKDGEKIEIIKDTHIQLSFPALSPDGEKAAFIIKDSSGSDIVIHNIGTEIFIRLGSSGSTELHPAFTPDGGKLLFSSDMDGVYNIYEYSPEDRRTRKLTNLTGGGFHPSASPSMDRIVFSNYGKNGGVISIMDYTGESDPASGPEPETLNLSFFKSSPVEDTTEKYTVKGYNPLYSMAPPFVMPLIASSEIYADEYEWIFGFFTMGYDVLMRHFYQATALAAQKSKNADVEILYSYLRFHPEFTIGYHDNTLFFDDDPFPWEDKNRSSTKRQLSKNIFGAVTVPRIRYNSYTSLTFFISKNREITDYWDYPTETEFKFEHRYTRPGLYFIYDTSERYTYSVRPEAGRSFHSYFSTYHEEDIDTADFYKAEADYSEYLCAPGESAALILNLKGGYSRFSEDYSAPFNLGSFKSGSTGTEKNTTGIRGYPAGYLYTYRFTSLTCEYHLPLLQRDAGRGMMPLLFRDLWIALFAEGGNFWDERFETENNRFSAGAELHTRLTLGYHMDIEAYIGYARGFNEGGENQLYFAVGTAAQGLYRNRIP